MVVDVTKLKSHPDKSLLVHMQGVMEKVKQRNSLKIAEIAALFHDVGKINPNFQRKLNNEKVRGYSNHAYLSAFSFLCYCTANQKEILELVGNRKELLASIVAIIAHHHGDLPNFPLILAEEESKKLIRFLEKKPRLLVSELIGNMLSHNTFSVIEQSDKDYLCTSLPIQLTREIKNPLDYFIETQFAFASLIAADKEDASGYKGDEARIKHFRIIYHNHLQNYLAFLSVDSKINRIRTDMRVEALKRLNCSLEDGDRIYSLTAPTGSGKTLILLSLADKIMQSKGNFRIIYALPFLSITEQVEDICNKIFEGHIEFLRRIDSKSENKNFEIYQRELDKNPEKLVEILEEQFAEDTFDYPFIVTTFVKVFETLISNKNSALLKLPNFSNTIFLIDEIQALPPRLYGFFVALLDTFCKKFNSYAIISTATMPNFELPTNNKHDLISFFCGYKKPPELLSLKYFNEDVFNRYEIHRLSTPVTVGQLANEIRAERDSILVILNTIQDTKELYNQLLNTIDGVEIRLLNTHFTPNDRRDSLHYCKKFLKNNNRVILISTQLIEAGVDIDFPIVYRDLCPIPNIVQSAGRCNRNGVRLNKGRVVFFNLEKDGRSRAAIIYRGADDRFLSFADDNITRDIYQEPELLALQQEFFSDIQSGTIFGLYKSNDMEIDFVQKIKDLEFETIGRFQLIDKKFGEEVKYYILSDPEDDSYEHLEYLLSELREIKINDYQIRKVKMIQVENQIKKMSGQIVQVRIGQNDSPPIPEKDKCCGIYKLSLRDYDKATGIKLNFSNQIL